jgi:glycosidase
MRAASLLLTIPLAACAPEHRLTAPDFANTADRQLAPILLQRDSDWRIGPVVYQVFVDRFAPPAPGALDAKRHFYAAPRSLKEWDELPKPGARVEGIGCMSHELDFWGGDLNSLRERLPHIDRLGADVLYLNPIHAAFTNHKYDAQDFLTVSPEYGSRDDVKSLAADCHDRGLRLMLDGVFNHMGRTAPIFQEALRDPASRSRAWFDVNPAYKHGHRAWYNSANLPELNLENPTVRARLWDDPDSVVRGYLQDGVDGWRLDVAYDLGFTRLAEITAAAHETRPDSCTIGEIWNYPEQWMPALDGVMNFHARQIMLDYLHGKMTGSRAGRLLNTMIDDTGIEHILKCWLVLDNHDTARLTHTIAERDLRRVARVLQFTLPGAPCVYYGSEIEMEGGDDPANRAPMRWDLVADDNDDYLWFKNLVAIRKRSRALRLGEWRLLDSDSLLAFQRHTDRWNETAVIVANSSPLPVAEVVSVRDSKLMNFAPLVDQLSGREVALHSGMIEVEVPGHTAMLLMPAEKPGSDYSAYKRVQ